MSAAQNLYTDNPSPIAVGRMKFDISQIENDKAIIEQEGIYYKFNNIHYKVPTYGKIYKIPRFKSDKTIPSSNGIKAQEVKANKKVSTGAAKKITVFALLGKTGSLSKSFNPSAKG